MKRVESLLAVVVVAMAEGCTSMTSVRLDGADDASRPAGPKLLEAWAYPYNLQGSEFAVRTRQHWARFQTADGIQKVFQFYTEKMESAMNQAMEHDDDGSENLACSFAHSPDDLSALQENICVVLLRTARYAVSVHMSRQDGSTSVFLVVQDL